MKKLVLPLLLSAGLGALVIAPYEGLAATSQSKRIEQELNQIKQQKLATQQKAADAEKQMAQVSQEKQQTATDINVIMDQIDATNQKLNTLNNQAADVTTLLKDNARQLDEAEDRITSRDQMLKSRLRLMYMNGVVSYADVLFSSTSFGDFLDRLNALKSIVNQDKEILEANKRDHTTIAEKRVVIEDQLVQVKNLQSQTSTVKATLIVQEKEKEVKIASLSQKEQELEHISEDAEKQLVAFATQESAKQKSLQKAKADEAAKKANTSSSGSSAAPVYSVYQGGGKFLYPLPNYVNMSSDFGTRVDPITGARASHTGLDLPSPAGTTIRAAEAGTVIVASWWSGYGNTVIIDHGGGLWSLYGHIRNDGIVVEKGDIVKQGQKIAEVGSTGRSTGNHLHFEVRINGSAVDPKPYLNMR